MVGISRPLFPPPLDAPILLANSLALTGPGNTPGERERGAHAGYAGHPSAPTPEIRTPEFNFGSLDAPEDGGARFRKGPLPVSCDGAGFATTLAIHIRWCMTAATAAPVGQ